MAAILIRYGCRDFFCRMNLASIVLQACVRMHTCKAISRQKSDRIRSTFRRAYLQHKNAIMNEIRHRRILVQRIQSVLRRALVRSNYFLNVSIFRSQKALERLQKESAMLLSSRARAILVHRKLREFALCACLLRRTVRSRSRRDRYAEAVRAASTLLSALRAVSVQLRSSRAFRIPLLRLVQHARAQSALAADAAAAVLQTWCRVWCMETLGQHSGIEPAPEAPRPGRRRLHLSHRQKTAAAAALQGAARRLLASSRDPRLLAQGYAAVLDAGAALQARARGLHVRTLLLDIIRRYSAMVAQAAARMRRARAAYCAAHAAGRALAVVAQRALCVGHHGRVPAAQLRLQAAARMRAAPPPALRYSRMPTRALAAMLQARIRMCACRAAFLDRRRAAVPAQALARRAVYRLLYLTARVWCRKTGQAADLDLLFGRLTRTSIRTGGGPLWRTGEYLAGRERRAAVLRRPAPAVPLEGGGGGGRHSGRETVRARLWLRERGHADAVASRRAAAEGERQAGGLLCVRVPTGGGGVLHEGRLARVAGPAAVYLDPRRAADGRGAYVNFFLRVSGCGPPRRVVDYGPGGRASVWPAFEARPFADAAYRVEDLEPEPVAPDWDGLLRGREDAAAGRIQRAVRRAWARRDVAARRRARDQARRRAEADAAVVRAEEAEREAARRRRREQEAARQEAFEAARRRLLEASAVAELEVRQRQTHRQAQLERLYGVRRSVSESLGDGGAEPAGRAGAAGGGKGGKSRAGLAGLQAGPRDAGRGGVYYSDSARAADGSGKAARYRAAMVGGIGAGTGPGPGPMVPTPPPRDAGGSRRGFRRRMGAGAGAGAGRPTDGGDSDAAPDGDSDGSFPSPDRMRQKIDADVHALYVEVPEAAAAIKPLAAY